MRILHILKIHETINKKNSCVFFAGTTGGPGAEALRSA